MKITLSLYLRPEQLLALEFGRIVVPDTGSELLD